MTFRRITVTALAAVAVLGCASSARAADPPTYTINPSTTDPAIIDTPTPPGTRGNHLVWLADEPRRVGKLLVFIPFGGAANNPANFQEFGSVAGRLGYHTISLAYRNEAPIANATACGNDPLPVSPPSPPNCAIDARMEMLNGLNTSTVVNVNPANSIENRLNKLLAHLAATHPGDGWAQFIQADGTPKWSETVISGASLGAGFAALIASSNLVHRVAMFGGWTDAQHPEGVPDAPRLWVKIGATPAEKYFSLIHLRDVFYARTCAAYAVFAMPQTCPLPIPADPADLAENRPLPFGTRQLVFDIPRDPTAPEQVNGSHHPSVIRDTFIAKATPGGTDPAPALVNFWRSTLGDSDADGYLDPGDALVHADNCPQIANAGQADADHDGIGDVCDSDRDGDTVANSTDNCPDTANASQADADSDAIGDACDSDRDGDTVANATDNCPDTANSGQADADADAIGDICDSDRDGDTVANSTDNCPDTANPSRADADSDGLGDACDATPRGTTPPVITVTGATVDATGPAGALVPYTATATDDLDGTPSVTCTPAAGQFAIGATTITCSATDAGGNTANPNFTVTVRGAPAQLGRLVTKVGGSPALAALFASFDPNRPLQRLAVCITLRAFIGLVPFVAPTHATEWIADANRIRAVLAC